MQDFSEYVGTLKRKIRFAKDEIVFICIGSKDVVWDSVGPCVGSYLKRKIGEKYVIGDLENNICCQGDLKYFYPKMRNKFVVAIDSAIAEKQLYGEIFVTDKPIIMGLGINKSKGIVGNIGIKAGVDKDFSSKKYILEISKIIADGILLLPFWRITPLLGTVLYGVNN